jgi:hypothetical protein
VNLHGSPDIFLALSGQDQRRLGDHEPSYRASVSGVEAPEVSGTDVGLYPIRGWGTALLHKLALLTDYSFTAINGGLVDH